MGVEEATKESEGLDLDKKEHRKKFMENMETVSEHGHACKMKKAKKEREAAEEEYNSKNLTKPLKGHDYNSKEGRDDSNTGIDDTAKAVAEQEKQGNKFGFGFGDDEGEG